MCGDETPRIKYIIPIKSKKKWWQFWKKSEDPVGKLMNDYKQEIGCNDETGEISINGTQSLMPFTKEFWFPVKD